MGYFDGLTDGLFKRGSDSRALFYPWGVLGSGYVIPNDEERQKLRDKIKRLYIIILPMAVILPRVIGLALALVLFSIFCVWYRFFARSVTRHLEKSTEVLTIKESMSNSVRSHGWPVLIVLEVGCLVFAVFGIFRLVWSPSWAAGGIVAIFGILAVGLCIMLFVKARQRRDAAAVVDASRIE